MRAAATEVRGKRSEQQRGESGDTVVDRKQHADPVGAVVVGRRDHIARAVVM